SVVTRNRTTRQRINVTLDQAAAPFVGMMLFNVTRAAWCWVQSIVSGNTVVLTQPLARSFTPPASFNSYPAQVNNFTPGDSYEIWRPTQVALAEFQPQGPSLNDAGSYEASAANLWITSNGIASQPQSIARVNASCHAFTMMRCDAFLYPTTDRIGEESGTWTNVFAVGGVTMDISSTAPSWIGGAIGTPDIGQVTNISGCVLDADIMLLSDTVVFFPGTGVLGQVYASGAVSINGFYYLNRCNGYGAFGALWGTYDIDVTSGAVIEYDAPDPTQGFNTDGALTIDSKAIATAFDAGVEPATWHAGRALSASALGTSIADGGFGGTAIDVRTGARIAASTISSPSLARLARRQQNRRNARWPKPAP